MHVYAITCLTAAFALLVVLIQEIFRPVDKRWTSPRRFKLPPGPRGSPVVGNLLQFWKARGGGLLDTYLLSLREYGDMTTLHLGSKTWVFLNTERVAEDIISKRTQATSERPHMPVSSGLVSSGKRSVLQLTASWTETRRLMRPMLTAPMIETFKRWQNLESVQMLNSYLDDPSEWYLHHSQYATAALYGLIGGTRLDKSTAQMDEYRRVTIQFLMSLYNNWIDFFPNLSSYWIVPRILQIWRGKWQPIGEHHRHVFRAWWEPMKASVKAGTSQPSWLRDVMLSPDMAFRGSEDDALYLTNSLISAGGDNIRMTLNTFVMVALAHPKVLLKCRDELDRICSVAAGASGEGATAGDAVGGPAAETGAGARKNRTESEGDLGCRLPGPDDIEAASYVCAFVKEILRWRPVVPFVIPHAASEEVEYEGFVFPKGTNFIINTVSICSNVDDPDAFQPERWMDGNQTKLAQGFWGFGGGRRICIGYKAVQPALFLAMARLIYCFDFEPNGPFDTRKLNHWVPNEPFPVRVKIRSPIHEKLIRSTPMNL